ncbi:MAG: response regulator transcription factor [Proteobacteria bacterium]|nr:response regulator transcription factor [Pseudomonadota bacterium]
MNGMTPAVHVVDDDASFRGALVRMLTARGYHAAAYSSGEDFLARGSQGCGCVVADLRMPQLDGLALQAACARNDDAMPFVFLSGNGDVPSAVTALKHGAVDFLEKCAPHEALLAAINGALQRDLIARSTRARQRQVRERLASLSEREQQVLALVVRGRMNKQIAGDLDIHERTVKLHRTAITGKLGVRSVAELTTLVHEIQNPPGVTLS